MRPMQLQYCVTHCGTTERWADKATAYNRFIELAKQGYVATFIINLAHT